MKAHVGENDVVKVGQIFTRQQCDGMCAQALKARAAASKRARAKKIDKGLKKKATKMLAELRESGVVRENVSEVEEEETGEQDEVARSRRPAKRRRRRLNEPIANGLRKVPMNGLRSVTNGDNKRWHLEPAGGCTATAKSTLNMFMKSLPVTHGIATPSVKQPTWLHSEKGCLAGPGHFDYSKDNRNAGKYGMVAALSPQGATFEYKKDRNAEIWERVELKKGEAVLFGGRVWHRGSAHDEINTRFHAYLFGEGVSANARVPNTIALV